jgi:Recombinational DNA repair ATPase (RecF pathway)
MRLSQLQLTNFRNYPSLLLKWSPGVNAIAAPNGAGKTNLLEAIHLLCFTRGFNPDKTSVRLGEDFYVVKGKWEPGRPWLQPGNPLQLPPPAG